MAAACDDLADAIAWTSPSGTARALYISGPDWSSALQTLARLWLALLLFVPLALATLELYLGIAYRQMPTGCTAPLHVWVLVDGSAALLWVVLSLVDIARVEGYLQRAGDAEGVGGSAAQAAAGGGGSSGVGGGSHVPASKRARARRMGSYAWLGFLVVFLVPLFRLLWLLWGIDLLAALDGPALSSFALAGGAAAHAGRCPPALYAFVFYYVAAVMVLLLAAAGLVLVAAVAAVALSIASAGGQRGRGGAGARGAASSQRDGGGGGGLVERSGGLAGATASGVERLAISRGGGASASAEAFDAFDESGGPPAAAAESAPLLSSEDKGDKVA